MIEIKKGREPVERAQKLLPLRKKTVRVLAGVVGGKLGPPCKRAEKIEPRDGLAVLRGGRKVPQPIKPLRLVGADMDVLFRHAEKLDLRQRKRQNLAAEHLTQELEYLFHLLRQRRQPQPLKDERGLDHRGLQRVDLAAEADDRVILPHENGAAQRGHMLRFFARTG